MMLDLLQIRMWVCGCALTLLACATVTSPVSMRIRSPDEIAYCRPAAAPRNAFRLPNATRYLVLDFRPSSEQRQEVLLGRRAAGKLHRLLRDHLVNIASAGAATEKRQVLVRKIDAVREECVPEDDAAAREMAQNMGADLVLWGESSCPLVTGNGAPLRNLLPPVEQSVRAESGGTAIVEGEMKVNLHLSEKALEQLRDFEEGSYCVHAAFTASGMPGLRTKGDERMSASAAQADIDLPQVVGRNAYTFIVFVAGLHFYRQEEYSNALRLFRSASEPLRSDAPSAADLLWVMGDTEMRAGEFAAAVKYFESASTLAQSGGDAGWKHRLALLQALALSARTSEASALAGELLGKVGQVHGDDTRGYALGLLSNSLAALGRREEALAAIREAAEVYRRLAAVRPEAFEPYLATSLNNLSNSLGELGKCEEGLATIREAVDVYRRLATARPEAFEPGLAMSLNSLSVRLGELGMREEGLAAIREAVDVYRRLARARPEAFEPGLAMSLNNLSVRLGELGMREEGLAAIREAVDVYRRLARARPEAFEPDLAMSLNNLSVRLGKLAMREEGLAAIREAVKIRRRLARVRPEVFEPDLAVSLNNLSNRLGELGTREEGLEVIREAVDLYRRLARARPEAFERYLAASLNNLSNRLGDLGRREDALAAIREAAEIRRRLAAARPEAFEPNLAMSLSNLSLRLANLGRWEDALAAIREAVEIRRRLAAARPEAFEPDLAMSLSNLCLRLKNLGRREEALAAIREEAEIRRRLAAPRPAVFTSDPAQSLNKQAGPAVLLK